MTKDNLKLTSLFIFFLLTVYLGFQLHEKEVKYAQKEVEYNKILNENIEIEQEKVRLTEEYIYYKEAIEQKMRGQEDLIRSQNEKLKELNEFKDILETVKKFSRGTLNNEERVVTALSIHRASKETKLNWKVISAVIMTESSYRADIVSGDPSYGLMQIKLPTANYMARKNGENPLTKEELLSIEKNIQFGSRYLLSQAINFSSLSEGVMAYNFGGGKLRQLKREKKTKFESTYLKKIKKHHQKINNFLEDQRY